MVHHIEVENIKCGGCMNTIRQSIQKLEGVHSVEIEDNKTSLHIDADTSREVLVEKLAAIGCQFCVKSSKYPHWQYTR